MKDFAHRRVARYHQPIGLSLLFRSLPKTGRRPLLNVEYVMSEGRTLRFSAREALGVPEQTLLLVILELVGEQFAHMGQGVLLQGADGRQLPNRLWEGLYPDGGTGQGPSVMVNTTWEELNRRCGSDNGGSAIRVRKESMRRLCEVVVWEEFNQRRTTHQSFLVVWCMGDDRRIHLALNHRLASAFLGAPFAKVSLEERLRLGRDLPMVVHAFLSTCIWPGHQLKIGLDKLAARIWPMDHDTAPEGTVRRRRAELVRALNSIGQLKRWSVTWEREGALSIVYRKGKAQGGVREMPSSSEAGARTAFDEQSGRKKNSKDKSLSQYDVSGLFN